MKQIMPILLAIFILTSSIGIKVNKHFCEKEGLKISYFTDFNDCTCEVPVEKHSCCKKKQEKQEKKDDGCCHDESEYLIFDENYTVDNQVVSIDDFANLQTAIYYSIFSPKVSLEEEASSHVFKEYSPPLPDKDIPVFVQSFLI